MKFNFSIPKFLGTLCSIFFTAYNSLFIVYSWRKLAYIILFFCIMYSYLRAMNRVCDLLLDPKFGERPAARKNLHLRLAVEKLFPFADVIKKYLRLDVVLGNTFLCILAFNLPQSTMKVFLNNYLDNWNLQSLNPYVISLQENSCLIMLKGMLVKIHYS